MKAEPLFYWHWQNLNDAVEKGADRLKGLFRHGRAWFNFEPIGKMRIEWHFFDRSSSTALWFSFAAEEEDFEFHAAFLWLFSIFLSFSNVPVLHQLFADIRSGYGYQTGVRFFDNAIWLDVCMSDQWGSRPIKWIERLPGCGFGGRAGMTYKEYDHWHGFQVNFHYLNFLLGREYHSERLIGTAVERALELHPDTTWLGHSYMLTIQMKEHSWKRTRWFVTTRRVRADVKCNPPIPIPGKGESAWDLGDDALHGGLFNALSPEEAVQAVKRSVIEEREKYGLPDVIMGELEEFIKGTRQ